eukprot:1036722-Amphidinium_carterae.1
MLHTRLSSELDKFIVDYQYDFRSGRSSSQPVYVSRRLMDIAEHNGSSFYFTPCPPFHFGTTSHP